MGCSASTIAPQQNVTMVKVDVENPDHHEINGAIDKDKEKQQKSDSNKIAVNVTKVNSMADGVEASIISNVSDQDNDAYTYEEKRRENDLRQKLDQVRESLRPEEKTWMNVFVKNEMPELHDDVMELLDILKLSVSNPGIVDKAKEWIATLQSNNNLEQFDASQINDFCDACGLNANQKETCTAVCKQVFKRIKASRAIVEAQNLSKKLLQTEVLLREIKREAEDSSISSFENLVLSSYGFEHFWKFLKKEMADENLLFWKEERIFRSKYYEEEVLVKSIFPSNNPKSDLLAISASHPQLVMKPARLEQIKKDAQQLFNNYVKAGAPSQVNVSSLVVDTIKKNLERNDFVDPRLFLSAAHEVFVLLKNDAYRRFLESDEYKELAKAVIKLGKQRLHSPIL